MINGGQNGDRVAGKRAYDEAVRHGVAHRRRSGLLRRIEKLPGSLVADQLDGADQPDAAGLPDQRVAAEGVQALLEARGDAADVSDDVALLVDLERLDGDRGGHRVAPNTCSPCRTPRGARSPP